MSLPGGRPATAPTDSPARALSERIEALVVRWGGVIQRAARQYGLSAHDLDEVTQDVRVRLWNLIERDGMGADVNATYAWRAASSAAIDLVRRDRLSRSAATVAIDETVLPHAPDDSDLLERLDIAIASLPRSRRVAVRLHLDGASLAEVAVTLGWTSAQARNQVYRGLADLKRILTSDGSP
ncbi:MAG: sigma-70 family RNA polymerase sigma factor [Gemmatimonadaceae bacterium]|nr:sigma-70 family RNA polymerase sigma factor [Gemmatimonadaceae bacterium]